MTSRRYKAYLKSDAWADKRQELINLVGYQCEVCRKRSGAMHVHHLSYSRLYREKMSDLVLLCPSCHKIADWHRKKSPRKFQEEFVRYKFGRWRKETTLIKAYKSFVLDMGIEWQNTIFGICLDTYKVKR